MAVININMHSIDLVVLTPWNNHVHVTLKNVSSGPPQVADWINLSKFGPPINVWIIFVYVEEACELTVVHQEWQWIWS